MGCGGDWDIAESGDGDGVAPDGGEDENTRRGEERAFGTNISEQTHIPVLLFRVEPRNPVHGFQNPVKTAENE